jgi:hypothetical protein
MAKRNSMSTARRSRNRKQESAAQNDRTTIAARRGDDSAAKPSSENTPADLAGVIGDERARLMKAQAVLQCVAFALLYDDWLEQSNRPCFADAVNVAQDLISEAVDRLDRGPRPPPG